MKKHISGFRLGLLTVVVSVWSFSGGCAPIPGQPESILGTPKHHTYNGFKLLKKGRLDDAQREFEISLQLQPNFSTAHRGMGLAYGMKKQFKPAFRSMDFARDYARGKDEEALVFVGFMRLYMMKNGKGWMEEVEENFNHATSLIADLPDAYYYMGVAYKNGYRFSDSEKAFKKVLEINKSLITEADEQLKIVQKIERAMPESEFGKKVALMNRITRADVAGLFVKELTLDQIFEKARPKQEHTDIRTLSLPPDVKNHPLKKDMGTVLQWHIKGLSPFPDGTFRPDELITWADYAIMVADIIAKAEDDPTLATKYVGTRTPFKDVGNDVPYFNALMVCTTRGGIMEAKNGIFNPMRNVSGADALLVLRKLKEELGIS